MLGIIFQWAIMNAMGIALAMTMRQMAFQASVGQGTIRLVIEGVVVGLFMGGIQTYAITQAAPSLKKLKNWFILSGIGWTIGWAVSWILAWQILGTQRFDVVFASRGLFVGFLVGGLQWQVLKLQYRQTVWWLPANGIGWGLGFWVTMTIGGAFAWILAGGVAGLIGGLALAWMLIQTETSITS